MISSGEFRYWSTGITVEWREHAGSREGVPFSGWGASLQFLDDGFCDDDTDQRAVATQGELRTRYFVADGEKVSGLSMAIDALLIDAARIGVEFRQAGGGPFVYYKGDGEWKDYPPPDGWVTVLNAEAARIGWQSYGSIEGEGSR